MGSLLATSAMSASAAALGGLGTDPDSAWYRSLDKPGWQPPPVAFPLVWTPLYATIAWGTARMIDAEPDPRLRKQLFALVGADLIVNAGWCWSFFKTKSPAAGLATIVGLDGLNVALLREAWKRDRRAAVALVPYVVWSGFATALSFSIWRRNR